jgi:hypothetical protein
VQQQVVGVGAAADVVRDAREHVGEQEDRDARGGRQQQEGGDHERLGRRSREGADREAHVAGERQQHEQQGRGGPRRLPPGGQPGGQRRDRAAHRERAGQLGPPVARREWLGSTVGRRTQKRLEARIEVEGGSHPPPFIGVPS